jgi:hypothetical protein
MTEIIVQRLKDRIEQLEDVLGVGKPMTERLALSFGIDIELGVFLGMLYRRQFVTREGLYTVMYEGRPECDWPEPKVLDIHLCRLRKVLTYARRDGRDQVGSRLAYAGGLQGDHSRAAGSARDRAFDHCRASHCSAPHRVPRRPVAWQSPSSSGQ